MARPSAKKRGYPNQPDDLTTVALTPSNPTNTPNLRKDAEQEVFMREVDEAVRQDAALGFLQQYGLKLGLGIAAALAAFGGFLFWQHQQNSALEEHSEQLTAAMDEVQAGNLDIAETELAAITGDGGAAGMAQMLRAGIAQEAGRTAEAGELFATVAANENLPQEVRDLALIRQVTAQFAQLDPQDVIDRLGPLAEEDSPWFGSAGEIVALAYLEQGKDQEAGELLAKIANDEDLPQSLRGRSRQLAGFLGVDAIEDVDATLEELGGNGPSSGPAAGQP